MFSRALAVICATSLLVSQMVPCVASVGPIDADYAQVVYELDKWFAAPADQRDSSSVVRAIDEWLRTNPAQRYREPTQEQALRWKLQLTRIYQSTDLDFSVHVYVYSSLLEEMDDSQFAFLGRTYNRESINLWLLEASLAYYSGYGEYCYYVDSSAYDYSPTEHFVREYAFFQEKVRSWETALAWLRAFCDLGARCAINRAGSIVTESSDDLLTVLKLYLFMGSHVLKTNPDRYIKSKAPYAEGGSYILFGSGIEEVLFDAYSLIDSIRDRLSDTARKELMNFVYPDYIDIDEGVLIYALLLEE